MPAARLRHWSRVSKPTGNRHVYYTYNLSHLKVFWDQGQTNAGAPRSSNNTRRDKKKIFTETFEMLANLLPTTVFKLMILVLI